MEVPGRLQSMGSQRVGYHWATSLSLFTFPAPLNALHRWIHFILIPAQRCCDHYYPIWQMKKLTHREIILFALWTSASSSLIGGSVDCCEDQFVTMKSASWVHHCCWEPAYAPSIYHVGACLLTIGGALGSLLGFPVTLEQPALLDCELPKGPHFIYPCSLSTWTSMSMLQEFFPLSGFSHGESPSKRNITECLLSYIICVSYSHPDVLLPGH